MTRSGVTECLMLDQSLPRSARFSSSAALDSVSHIEGSARRSKPLRLLARLNAMYQQANTQAIVEHPLDFDAECRTVLRQLEVSLRETYFHPSKVSAAVTGEEGRGVPQQQQQL